MREALIILSALLAGCSSIMTLSTGSDVEKAQCKESDYVPRIYSGVFNDFRLFETTPSNETLFLITDIPFSFVVDTIALPYTITTQIVWGNICPPPEK